MPKSSNQKLKLLYIKELLEKYSDEEHPVTVADIQKYLAERDVAAERKSIYSDIEMLTRYGMDIIYDRRGYYLASRSFELPELKLLVDSVQASKFITRKKSEALISKLEELAGAGQARQLQRQVYVANRVKTMNESIYYNIDRIHKAISEDRQIKLKYFDYAVSGEKVFRRGGAYYKISPFALLWDDENYYLVAYDAQAGMLKHYRVDKMLDIRLDDAGREGRQCFESEDISSYSKKVFGMFNGEKRTVTMEFQSHLANAVIDRMGKETIRVPRGEDRFSTTAEVVVSPQFFAWLCGFGDEAKITYPPDVAEQMRRHVEKIEELYAPGTE